MTVIAPGSFIDAAKQHYPELLANLTDGSAWMELIQSNDDATRNNSPYYGPATQFLVDCFFDIAAATPELAETSSTPLARYRTADYVIHQYIGNFVVGPKGLLTMAYDSSDIAATSIHQRRRNHLVHDSEHVLLGASVPFDDMARVVGGAALMLETPERSKPEIVNVIANSTGLQIVAGVHGDKTPVITNELGLNYLEPSNFLLDENGTVQFSPSALQLILSILSPNGCPTAKLKDGSHSLFARYWNKITHYLLDNVSYEDMRHELEAQRPNNKDTTVILPASQTSKLTTPLPNAPLKQILPPKKPKRKR